MLGRRLPDRENLGGQDVWILRTCVSGGAEQSDVAEACRAELIEEGNAVLGAGDSGEPIGWLGFGGRVGFPEDKFGRIEAAAGAHGAGKFTEDGLAGGIQVEDAIDDRGIKTGGGEREALRVGLTEVEISETHFGSRPAGVSEHGGAEVEAQDHAGALQTLGKKKRVQAGAASEVEDAGAGRNFRGGREVRYAGEGFDGGGGNAVQPIGGIAEAFGERAAGGEGMACVRSLGDR